MAPMRFDRTGGGGTARGRRLAAIALSVAAHLVLLPALFLASGGGSGPTPFAPPPMLIELEPPPVPEPPPAEPPPGPVADSAPPEGPPAEAAAAAAPTERPVPARVPPPRPRPAVRPPPPEVLPLPAAPAAPAPLPVWATVGEAELAGALRAGRGSGAGAGAGGGGGAGSGGPCDMVGRLERALRDDAEVATAAQRALAGSGRGRALLVWNGDWVTSPGEAGKGLAGVRQAIAVEVAFAPSACRAEAVRGYAVLALGDGPGAPRLALGPGTWRWGDLTGARRGGGPG